MVNLWGEYNYWCIRNDLSVNKLYNFRKFMRIVYDRNKQTNQTTNN